MQSVKIIKIFDHVLVFLAVLNIKSANPCRIWSIFSEALTKLIERIKHLPVTFSALKKSKRGKLEKRLKIRHKN